jgi:hypothetical protein
MNQTQSNRADPNPIGQGANPIGQGPGGGAPAADLFAGYLRRASPAASYGRSLQRPSCSGGQLLRDALAGSCSGVARCSGGYLLRRSCSFGGQLLRLFCSGEQLLQPASADTCCCLLQLPASSSAAAANYGCVHRRRDGVLGRLLPLLRGIVLSHCLQLIAFHSCLVRAK